MEVVAVVFFFFSSRRRHTRSLCDWSSDVCSSDLGEWGMYSGPLEDFQRMINKGVAAGVPNWEAVGRIMKSYVFSVMTDAMGDIPYSEAFQERDRKSVV